MSVARRRDAAAPRARGCRAPARRARVAVAAVCAAIALTGCSGTGAGSTDPIEHGDGVARTDRRFSGWAEAVGSFVPGENRWGEDDDTRALGPATGKALDVTVLGRGGSITLTFDPPITDGPGADFAVFENGFVAAGDAGLSTDLAGVSVSGDGITFVQFPLETDNRSEVGAFGTIDPRQYRGFGGLHPLGRGTAFDLAQLETPPAAVTHIRIDDVIGDGSLTDRFGNPIYDPYPTVGTAGFDLEAIGVLSR